MKYIMCRSCLGISDGEASVEARKQASKEGGSSFCTFDLCVAFTSIMNRMSKQYHPLILLAPCTLHLTHFIPHSKKYSFPPSSTKDTISALIDVDLSSLHIHCSTALYHLPFTISLTYCLQGTNSKVERTFGNHPDIRHLALWLSIY